MKTQKIVLSLDSAPPVPDLKDVEELQLDLQMLQLLTSLKIKYWLTWLPKVVAEWPKVRITLHQVPTVMVKSMFNIYNFIPRSVHVSSVPVSYYCEKCDFLTESLLEHGKHYGRGIAESRTMESLSHTKCAECGQQADLEGFADQFLFVFKNFSP